MESATKFGNTRTSTRTSTRQVPDKYPDKLYTANEHIVELVQIIGETELSVKDMLIISGLKNRENFLEYHLNPAIAEGYVCLLYPDKPRHPRQKYQLTMKGVALYNELKK